MALGPEPPFHGGSDPRTSCSKDLETPNTTGGPFGM